MKKLIILLLACALLLIGCSKNDQEADDHEPKETDRENKDETVADSEPEQGENMYPLTGLYTDDPVDNRIISVMVNNHGQARPQSGLSEADVVFEILAEGRITRFLALFQSEIPDIIGPVRSAREYYFELANNYDALYVYHGAAGFVDDMIVNRGIHFINGAIHDNDGYLFKREAFRKAPHNSYFLTNAVYEAAENKGYETTIEHEALPFLEREEIDELFGDAGKKVRIVYSNNPSWIVDYEYDETLEKYKRYSEGVLTAELNTEEEVLVDNVFILETYHEIIDDVGRRKVDLASGGNAYLLQKGIVQQVEWKSEDGRIVPVKDGKTIGLVPGKTWINVIPSSPGLEQTVTITND